MPRLAQLKSENEQIAYLAQRIGLVSEKVDELKEFDHKLKVMVNLESPENNNMPLEGVGGASSDALDTDPASKMGETNRELVRSMHHSLDNIDEEIILGQQDKAELCSFLESQKLLLASTPSIWPTRGWLSCGFGYRISPFTDKKEFHKGIDIATRSGTPVVASADGIITYVGWNGGFGRTITINHGYGLVTKYAHLKKALVTKRQYVKRGEQIALVGNSGRSTGPHLHYEVHLNKVAVNPLQYILN